MKASRNFSYNRNAFKKGEEVKGLSKSDMEFLVDKGLVELEAPRKEEPAPKPKKKSKAKSKKEKSE